MKNLLLSFFSLLVALGLDAQVVTTVPALPTASDTITVLFDASLGNGDLAGVGTVYAHTGVITNLSTSTTDWRHVQGNWGTADPNVVMTPLGGNLHEIKIYIPTFYNLPANETVQKMAFVFRNQDGSLVGRNSDGSDIFVDVFASGFNAAITSPIEEFVIKGANDQVQLEGNSTQAANLEFLVNGLSVATQAGATTLQYTLDLVPLTPGLQEVVFQATVGGTTLSDTLLILKRGTTPVAATPSYGQEGMLVTGDSSMYFQIRAPFKNYIYLIGDFNNWQPHPDYELSRTPDGQFFWIEINGLDPNQEYRFQYWVNDEALRIADPYSTKVLDPWNDGFINANTYPNLLPYPAGKTTHPVGVFQTKPTPYNWDSSYTYQRPAETDLVIYELLVRDFDPAHTFQSVIDRLPYLDSLGVNALQLMPIMEFEGNESWGYNPMFFMAVDKYYGPAEKFKELVDSCHRRGIAVILDIAMNHAFGQFPLVRLYWDANNNQPAANSPWFNPVAKHEFNVGYDFNHESAATRYYTKRVFQYWIEEYKIDGYRMDLSKGFTQVNTLGSVSAWGQYDASRIAIWEDYQDAIQEVDSSAYIILEHFANNDEEQDLSSRGFMLWGNLNHAYNESTMGFNSDLAGIAASNRGWTTNRLVGYAESHDEERLMYKNYQFGGSNAAYTTKDQDTALQRMAMAAALLYTVPGPKMLWQFGELGYDYSINYCPDGTVSPNCRLANKPIRWDYAQEPIRRKLFQTFAELIRLKTSYEVFRTGTPSYSLYGMSKQIRLAHSSMSVVVVANTSLIPMDVATVFPQTGWWYDHFNQDSLEVVASPQTIALKPGEWRLFTTQKVWIQAPQDTTAEPEPLPEQFSGSAYPNPFRNEVSFYVDLPADSPVWIDIHDINGRLVWSVKYSNLPAGEHTLDWDGKGNGNSKLHNGLYLATLRTNSETVRMRLLKVHK